MINAVSKGTFRQVQLYLSTCHNALTLTDPFGRTVLHIAASCGSSKLLQWLLPQLKNEKEVKDNESLWTALHRALFYGQIAAAKILIRVSRLYMTKKCSVLYNLIFYNLLVYLYNLVEFSLRINA